jgi:salicylate 5-hydroxylase small subunit
MLKGSRRGRARNEHVRARAYMRHIREQRAGSKGWQGDALDVQANYVVFETLIDQFTRVFQSGRYVDRLVVVAGASNSREDVVFDSVWLPNSLVFPIYPVRLECRRKLIASTDGSCESLQCATYVLPSHLNNR